ncbi:unnamed protein product [Calypogeia fissa]
MSVPLLESLPESIWELHSLTDLTLALGKNARSLLERVGQISFLKRFEFDCDGHAETPSLFAHLSSFAHELSLTGRKTRMLPGGLGSLSSLKELSLRKLTIMKTLPDELGKLCSLERLTIRWCTALESLPDSLGEVASLKEVRLEYCERLMTLPACLGTVGRPFSTQQALEEGHQSGELKGQAEESPHTKKTEAMQLIVRRCPLLDDSVLNSLGWMFMFSTFSGRFYRRYLLNEGSDPG